MSRYYFWTWLALLGGATSAFGAAGCTSKAVIVGENTTSSGSSSSSGGTRDPGDSALCLKTGAACASDSECCGGYCSPDTKVCSAPLMTCLSDGEPCEGPLACCGLACIVGKCAGLCLSDGAPCALSDECCGGVCEGGTCSPLSATCRTSGNECALNSECCSGSCAEGRCSLFGSFCLQTADVCRTASECCTGACDRVAGAPLGVCGAAPTGPSNCVGGLAGTLCGDCNDCCSRLCAPYGPSGLSICQPVNGCRVTGELCREDADCCGGDPDSGLPGASNVTCVKDKGATIGLCRNAMACSPQGNVCHFKDYACSVSAASNKCCDGASEGACELDALGVPRCNGLGDVCRKFLETCASPDDCCDELACLPDEGGRWVCGNNEAACVAKGGACSTTSDCCSALLCEIASGNAAGTCVPKAFGSCVELGQLCAGECCTGLSCADGRCLLPVP